MTSFGKLPSLSHFNFIIAAKAHKVRSIDLTIAIERALTDNLRSSIEIMCIIS